MHKTIEEQLQTMCDSASKCIGNTYGWLTVLEFDYDKSKEILLQGKKYGAYVKCRCKCGTVKAYRLNSIKTGHTYSCGCSRFNNPKKFEDLTGKKFGKLTVIERDIERDKIEEKGVHWLCKCDCGNDKLCSIGSYQLKSGHTQSCGCYASEKIAERNKKYSSKINKIQENNNGTITLFDDDNNKCLIDKEDYSIVKNWYWRKVAKRGNLEKGYWTTNSKIDDKYTTSSIFIHQIIAEIKYGEYNRDEVMPDHLSRDTNDNRKCNILLKPNIKNCKNRGISKANTSGKTGVSFKKDNNKWVAYINNNYKNIYLGEFNTKEDAIKTRKEAEKKYGYTCDDIVSEYDEAM